MKEHAKKEEQQASAQQKNGDATITVKQSDWDALTQHAARAQENFEKFVRLQADCENIRKRVEKEKAEFIKYANEGVIVDVLNVLDDLERTVALASKDHDESTQVFLQGVEMILAHLYDVLKKNGVKAVECKGKVFDPHCHEALLQIEDASVPEHTVVEEMQKGYLLHDRVIRTAKVGVSRLPRTDAKENKESQD
jgi:molecular chaperone GrpE